MGPLIKKETETVCKMGGISEESIIRHNGVRLQILGN